MIVTVSAEEQLYTGLVALLAHVILHSECSVEYSMTVRSTGEAQDRPNKISRLGKPQPRAAVGVALLRT
jgi:hypothetical protein